MTTTSFKVTIGLMLLTWGVGLACLAAAQYPVLYEHDHRRGERLVLDEDIPNFHWYDFNDTASSLVVPSGWTVTLWQHCGYDGRKLEVTGPAVIEDLKRDRPDGRNWGDTISSAQVRRTRDEASEPPELATGQEFLSMAPLLASEDSQEQAFEWFGTCEVRCDDGECRSVCRSGLVYARSAGKAELKARALLEAAAGSQGKVVRGSVRIEIRF